MAEGDLWFFDRVAPIYRRLMPPAERSALEAGLHQATRDIGRVIDLGGGTGRAALAIREHDPIVFDASRGMLERVPPRLRPVRASATRLPLGPASVDAILIVDAFHHLPAQSDVLGEVRRVLRPGGVVVIRDFDPGTVRGRMVAVMEHLIRMRSRFVAVSDLTADLDAAGFEPIVIDSGFAYTVVGRKPGGQ